MVTDFTTWLMKEMNERGWNNSELARRAGLVPSTISMVISERKRPGPSFCNGVARALKIPPERVFRLAGILPPIIIGNDETQECLEYLQYLSPESHSVVTALARTLYEKQTEYETDNN